MAQNQKKREKKTKLGVTLFDYQGKVKGELPFPSLVAKGEINSNLLAQAVRVFLANQRQAKAKVKTRGEVRGSRRKIWRQKGTGRARHGDRYAPIFVGGGVAHGPTGKENYRLGLSKKMRKKALLSALSYCFQENKIVAVEGLKKISPKTKAAVALLESIKQKQKGWEKKKKLIVIGVKREENVRRAFANLKGKGVAFLPTDSLNPYLILNCEGLIFEKEAVKVLTERLTQ